MVDVAQGKPCSSGSTLDVPQSRVDDRRGLSSAEVFSILSSFPRPFWARISDALADRRFGRKQRIYPPLQLNRDGLALPEITLCKDTRQIRLIGVMHLADRAVWDALKTLLRQETARAASIQFEAIRPVRRLNQDETQAARRRRALHRYLGLTLGMQYQTDAIAPGADWVHADLTDIELRSVANIPIAQIPAGAGSMLSGIGQLPIARSQRSRRVLMMASVAVAQLVPYLSTNSDAIVTARNRVAVRSALQSTSPRIISIWGAAHLPGIARLLVRDGWSVSSSGHWTTTCWDRGRAPSGGLSERDM